MPHEPMCIMLDDDVVDPRSWSARLSALQAGARELRVRQDELLAEARELRAGQDELRASMEGIVGVLETMLAGPPPKKARRVVQFKDEPWPRPDLK